MALKLEKKHYLEVVLVLGLVIIVVLNTLPFWSLERLPFLDPTTGQIPRILPFKESVLIYGDFFPLWNPYLNGGEPFYDGIFQGIDSLSGILIFIFPTFGGINLSFVIPIVLSALLMYLLAKYLFKDPLTSALVALIYSSTGYVIIMLITSSINQLIAYSINPLILLFVIRAFREKNWHLNAVLAGIFLALQIRLGPDLKVSLFMSLVLASFFFVQLITPSLKKVFPKVIAVGLVLSIVGAGLAADKILTIKETIDASNRARLTYEESSLRKTSLGEFFEIAIQPIKPGFHIRYTPEKLREEGINLGRIGWFSMGIIATILAAIGLIYNRTSRMTLFLVLMLAICFLVVTASPFFFFLWKYIPPWSSFRYVERGFSMWSLGIALAAGYGITTITAWIKSKNFGKNLEHWQIIAGMGFLLILNLLIFAKAPTPGYYCNIEQVLSGNQLWMSLKDEPGYFRVHELETRGIDWPADPYVVYAGLEHLYGYTSTWVPEYLGEYLVYAQQEPAKLWGIMNVKYISSMQPVNISGLKFVKQFPPVKYEGECPPREVARSYGPYLYQNEKFLPRAQISRNVVLVAGNDDAVRSATYQLMLSPLFDPSSTTIIMAEKNPVQKYSDIMDKLNTIIFVSGDAIDTNSFSSLEQFKQKGGEIIPDVVAGESNINQQALEISLNSTLKNIALLDSSIVRKSFDNIEIKISTPTRGFLVLSERFFYFNNWKAKSDGKNLELLRANGFVTAIPLSGDEKTIILAYESRGFKIGMTIFGLTILGLGVYFAFLVYKKINLKKKA